jgi:hypothetical protein
MNPPRVEKPIVQTQKWKGSAQAVLMSNTNNSFGMKGKLLIGKMGAF